MADEYDEQTERLLTKFPDSWSPSCQEVCDAVAAVLREAGKREADLLLRLHGWLTANAPGGWIDDLRQEVERLKKVIKEKYDESAFLESELVEKDAEIAALKAKLAEIEKVTK